MTIGAATQPTLGSNPPAPTLATPYSDGFDGPDGALTEQFRLTEAPRSFAGNPTTSNVADTATASGGATIAVDWPADPDTAAPIVRFSLGNAALGVDNVTLSTPNASGVRTATLADGRVLAVVIDTSDRSSDQSHGGYDWTAYGTWAIRSPSVGLQNGSQYVGGYETANAAIPTTGSATYKGFVTGNVAVPNGSSVAFAGLLGDATMTANFATGTLTGSAPSIMALVQGQPSQAWNGLTFSGTFSGGINGFTGATGVLDAPGGSFSLLQSASGSFAGRFFGPDFDEIGAVWNLSDGVGFATGTLVGGR